MKKINQDLKLLRRKIDKIDLEISKLIAMRMKYSPKIAKSKYKQGLPLFQRSRLEELLKHRSLWSKKLNLNRKFLLKIFKLVHNESLSIQKKSISKFKRKGNL